MAVPEATDPPKEELVQATMAVTEATDPPKEELVQDTMEVTEATDPPKGELLPSPATMEVPEAKDPPKGELLPSPVEPGSVGVTPTEELVQASMAASEAKYPPKEELLLQVESSSVGANLRIWKGQIKTGNRMKEQVLEKCKHLLDDNDIAKLDGLAAKLSETKDNAQVISQISTFKKMAMQRIKNDTKRAEHIDALETQLRKESETILAEAEEIKKLSGELNTLIDKLQQQYKLMPVKEAEEKLEKGANALDWLVKTRVQLNRQPGNKELIRRLKSWKEDLVKGTIWDCSTENRKNTKVASSVPNKFEDTKFERFVFNPERGSFAAFIQYVRDRLCDHDQHETIKSVKGRFDPVREVHLLEYQTPSNQPPRWFILVLQYLKYSSDVYMRSDNCYISGFTNHKGQIYEFRNDDNATPLLKDSVFFNCKNDYNELMNYEGKKQVYGDNGQILEAAISPKVVVERLMQLDLSMAALARGVIALCCYDHTLQAAAVPKRFVSPEEEAEVKVEVHLVVKEAPAGNQVEESVALQGATTMQVEEPLSQHVAQEGAANMPLQAAGLPNRVVSRDEEEEVKVEVQLVVKEAPARIQVEESEALQGATTMQVEEPLSQHVVQQGAAEEPLKKPQIIADAEVQEQIIADAEVQEQIARVAVVIPEVLRFIALFNRVIQAGGRLDELLIEYMRTWSRMSQGIRNDEAGEFSLEIQRKICMQYHYQAFDLLYLVLGTKGEGLKDKPSPDEPKPKPPSGPSNEDGSDSRGDENAAQDDKKQNDGEDMPKQNDYCSGDGNAAEDGKKNDGDDMSKQTDCSNNIKRDHATVAGQSTRTKGRRFPSAGVGKIPWPARMEKVFRKDQEAISSSTSQPSRKDQENISSSTSQPSRKPLLEVFSIYTNSPFIKCINIFDDCCGKRIYKSKDGDIVNFTAKQKCWLSSNPGRDPSDYLDELVLSKCTTNAASGFCIEVDVGDENCVFHLPYEDMSVINRPITRSIFTSRGEVHVTSGIFSNAVEASVDFLFILPQNKTREEVRGEVVLKVEGCTVGCKIFSENDEGGAFMTSCTTVSTIWDEMRLPLNRHTVAIPAECRIQLAGVLTLPSYDLAYTFDTFIVWNGKFARSTFPVKIKDNSRMLPMNAFPYHPEVLKQAFATVCINANSS